MTELPVVQWWNESKASWGIPVPRLKPKRLDGHRPSLQEHRIPEDQLTAVVGHALVNGSIRTHLQGLPGVVSDDQIGEFMIGDSIQPPTTLDDVKTVAVGIATMVLAKTIAVAEQSGASEEVLGPARTRLEDLKERGQVPVTPTRSRRRRSGPTSSG